MHLARSSRNSNGASGFSLIEVLVAVGLLAVVSISTAQLFAVATRANAQSKGQTSTTLLAVQKMEQLRSLTWGFDQASSNLGLPVSDMTTDLSKPEPVGGGLGLNPSPADTLTSNVAGYVDYLDTKGVWVGNGASIPAGAHYIRRWSITPLPTNPNNTLVLQVRVTTVMQAALASSSTTTSRWGQDAWLVSIKTRKAQ